jgi:ADP-heptose:LPS heptosyltransferase
LKKTIFIGHNALGDTLCTTPVIRAYRRIHPDEFLIYIVQNAAFCRVLDGNPDLNLVLYSEYMQYNGLQNFSLEWLHSLPMDLEEPSYVFHFDIQQVCTSHEAFQEHISKGFSRLLQIPIESTRPIVVITEHERRAARSYMKRPYVIFSMHSVANPERQDGQGRAKDWPWERWVWLAQQIRSWGEYDVIAVGSEFDARLRTPVLRNLYGLPIKVLAALIEEALCVVTLENGVAHLVAAVDAPTVQIYSQIVPLGWAKPDDVSCWRVIYGDPLEISGAEVAAAVQEVFKEKGSREYLFSV